jgi:hypothetical protein
VAVTYLGKALDLRNGDGEGKEESQKMIDITMIPRHNIRACILGGDLK